MITVPAAVRPAEPPVLATVPPPAAAPAPPPASRNGVLKNMLNSLI
jgi:hypothetical protein